jgi:hypothetical protein
MSDDVPAIVSCPPGEGWYWWRRYGYDKWIPVEVHKDGESLFSGSGDDREYQCGDDPETPFSGQWWPIRLEPPCQ